MKNSRFFLTIATTATVLIFGLTAGVNAKEAGPFMIGGITYWNDLALPELNEDVNLGDLPVEHKVDGSRAQLSVGVGYNLDEKLGFELFYVSIPERVISVTDVEQPPEGIPVDPISISWNTTIEHEIVGAAAVYDLHVNEKFSLFGKAGIAFARQTNESSITFGGRTTPIPNSLRPIVVEEDSFDLFGAVGARIPIRMGDASVTVAYQFVETSVVRETSLQLGVQWNF